MIDVSFCEIPDVLVVRREHTMEVWDTSCGALKRNILPPPDLYGFWADGRSLAARKNLVAVPWDEDDLAIVWHVNSGAELCRVSLAGICTFTPTGDGLISVHSSHIQIWDFKSGFTDGPDGTVILRNPHKTIRGPQVRETRVFH